MSICAQIAKQVNEVHFGGNWTSVNLKETLAGINWQQASTKAGSFNTIAMLTYHMNYFVSAVANVLAGGPLDAKDAYSFDHPPLHSQQDWEAMLDKTWADAERFATLIEQLPESRLWEDFTDKKYGTYYSNIQGIIEHIHYHLGQVVLIKKILQEKEK